MEWSSTAHGPSPTHPCPSPRNAVNQPSVLSPTLISNRSSTPSTCSRLLYRSPHSSKRGLGTAIGRPSKRSVGYQGHVPSTPSMIVHRAGGRDAGIDSTLSSLLMEWAFLMRCDARFSPHRGHRLRTNERPEPTASWNLGRGISPLFPQPKKKHPEARPWPHLVMRRNSSAFSQVETPTYLTYLPGLPEVGFAVSDETLPRSEAQEHLDSKREDDVVGST